jgi:hypothetical protein
MKRARTGTERTHEPNHLFADPARRRYRWLILPRYLDEESRKPILEGPERDRAHKIILRWANLESDGHLARKETALDAAFLHELFGDALGSAIPPPSTSSMPSSSAAACCRLRLSRRPGRFRSFSAANLASAKSATSFTNITANSACG